MGLIHIKLQPRRLRIKMFLIYTKKECKSIINIKYSYRIIVPFRTFLIMGVYALLLSFI